MTTSSSATQCYTYNTSTYETYDMSREDMPRAKKKQVKKDKKFKSEIMKWTVQHLKLSLSSRTVLFHSPMYTTHNSKLLHDFYLLTVLGYVSRTVSTYTYAVYDPFEGRNQYTITFVDGVLEHLPGIMAQALFLKNLMAKMNRERSCFLILHVKTRDQVCQEAERNNYPRDGKGYLVALPEGHQSRIEGMDRKEVNDLLAYGRIGSIWTTDISSKIKSSHIILWNGV